MSIQEDLEKKVDETKVAATKKISELWSKFAKYIYIGAGILVFIVAAVWLGKWYATGKAQELADSVHRKWAEENRPYLEQIERNKIRLEDLETNYKSQSEKIDKLGKQRGRGISDAVKKGDTEAIASMFDNIVDGYRPNK